MAAAADVGAGAGERARRGAERQRLAQARPVASFYRAGEEREAGWWSSNLQGGVIGVGLLHAEIDVVL